MPSILKLFFILGRFLLSKFGRFNNKDDPKIEKKWIKEFAYVTKKEFLNVDIHIVTRLCAGLGTPT